MNNLPKEFSKGPWCWRRFGNFFMLVTAHSGANVVLTTYPSKDPNTALAQRDANGVLQPLDPNHPDSLLIMSAPELLMAVQARQEADKHVEDCSKCGSKGWCKKAMELHEIADDRVKAAYERLSGQ